MAQCSDVMAQSVTSWHSVVTSWHSVVTSWHSVVTSWHSVVTSWHSVVYNDVCGFFNFQLGLISMGDAFNLAHCWTVLKTNSVLTSTAAYFKKVPGSTQIV